MSKHGSNFFYLYFFSEPEVAFPVVTKESQALSQEDVEIFNLIEEKKGELVGRRATRSKVMTIYEKSKKKFKKRESKYYKFLEEKGQFLRGPKGLYLEYNPDDISNS